MEPLGWDEIVSQPGMGGYLSFLNGPVPLPHLSGASPATTPDPGVVSAPAPFVDLGVATGAETAKDPGVVTAPEIDRNTAIESNTQAAPAPEVVSASGAHSATEPEQTPESVTGLRSFTTKIPGVVSVPAVAPGRIKVRRCLATHDGHSLGEEVLYQALWKAAVPESPDTRTIVIGWRGMSQLCRMTPKNCKINTQRLIRKLALEVLSPYNTPESIGTTYRIYSDGAILQRRRAAGLEWVVRSRGVEFVDPATGNSIMPTCAPTY